MFTNHNYIKEKAHFPCTALRTPWERHICYPFGQRLMLFSSIHGCSWISEWRLDSEGPPVSFPSPLTWAAQESSQTCAVSFRNDFLILPWPQTCCFLSLFTTWDHVANSVFGINLNSSGLNLITLRKLENVPSRLWGNSFCMQLQCPILFKIFAFWKTHSDSKPLFDLCQELIFITLVWICLL